MQSRTETNNLLKALIQKVEEGVTIKDACKVLGVSRSEVYKHFDKYQKRDLIEASKVANPGKFWNGDRGNEFSLYQLLALDREDLYFEDYDLEV